jgi:hypothetical protein
LGLALAKYLILTSSGGGGHLSVAKAEVTRLHAAGVPAHDISLVDITGLLESADNPNAPWIPTIGIPGTEIDFFSGKANIEHWNSAQRMGGMTGVQTQKDLIAMQPIAEAIQGPWIEEHLQQFLNDNPALEQIIDTQALSTARTTHVVGEHNRSAKHKPPIALKKIISEFITEKAVHYFKPLSNVSEEDAKYLTVETVNAPLVIGNESSHNFYNRNGVGHLHIQQCQKKPLRPAFFTQPTDTAQRISILTENNKERSFKKQPDDTVITLTLGSQGSLALLDYIDTFINQVLSSPPQQSGRTLLFIAAGKNDGSLNTLYAKTQAHLKQRMQALKTSGITWPEHAEILPLGFQNADHMASLFKHSDILISRSGGISSMEIEETNGVNPNRKVYIHTEAAPPQPHIFPNTSTDACYDALIEGTVPWEGGNAEYLIKKIDASLTSAKTIQFNLNPKEKLPIHTKSLLKLVAEDKLSKQALLTIDDSLKAGSNPNTPFITQLPLMAYAKDFETLRLLIQYGGQFTPAIQKHLRSKKIINHHELKTLQKIAYFQQAEIKCKGYTPLLHAEFYQAIETNHIASIKGLLYRHPKLAFSQYPNNPNQDIQTILRHAKGVPMLSLQLDHANSAKAVQFLRYQIYLQQSALNTQDNYGKTPLSYCKQPSLRKLMVFLGADPSHLNQAITASERKQLGKLFADSQTQTQYLQSRILKAYTAHMDDPDEFYKTLHTDPSLQSLAISREIIGLVFQDLHETQTQIDAMNIIQRFIHFIKYLFSADILTEQSLLESNKMMFYRVKNNDSNDSPDEIAPDISPK